MEPQLSKPSNGLVPGILAKAKEPPLQANIARVVIGAGYKVEVEIAEVTPEMANGFLEKMVNNRTVKQAHLRLLMNEIQTNSWCFTGQPLIFDPDGFLLDGQHRCWAIVKTGIAVTSLLARGVSRSAFDRIDAGAKRTGGDILGIIGTQQANATAAVISYLIGFRDGAAWYYPASGYKRTAHAVAAAAPLFPGLANSVRIGREAGKELGQRQALWSTAHYLMAQKDAETCTAFFRRIISGVGLTRTDPEYQLRKRMLECAKSSVALNNDQFAALVTNAWNNRRRGKGVTHLKGLVENADVPRMI